VLYQISYTPTFILPYPPLSTLSCMTLVSLTDSLHPIRRSHLSSLCFYQCSNFFRACCQRSKVDSFFPLESLLSVSSPPSLAAGRCFFPGPFFRKSLSGPPCAPLLSFPPALLCPAHDRICRISPHPSLCQPFFSLSRGTDYLYCFFPGLVLLLSFTSRTLAVHCRTLPDFPAYRQVFCSPCNPPSF